MESPTSDLLTANLVNQILFSNTFLSENSGKWMDSIPSLILAMVFLYPHWNYITTHSASRPPENEFQLREPGHGLCAWILCTPTHIYYGNGFHFHDNVYIGRDSVCLGKSWSFSIISIFRALLHPWSIFFSKGYLMLLVNSVSQPGPHDGLPSYQRGEISTKMKDMATWQPR